MRRSECFPRVTPVTLTLPFRRPILAFPPPRTTTMRKCTLLAALLISVAPATLGHAQETPHAVAVGPWRTGVAVHCPDGRTIPANTVISGPNVTAEELCGGSNSSGSSTSSTGGAIISNTGNTAQDLVTNSVNLLIVSHTTNPMVSSFMQGAATSFISAMFANNSAEAQRQRQLMEQEILRRKQEQERQRRIAEQQRFDAMYARLSSALKLEGVPFSLALKGMSSSSPESLELKGMSSSGPGELKLKLAESTPTSYGLKGLPGIYVGGPAGGDATTQASATATAAANPNLASGPGTGTTGPGVAGLPGVYLDGVQPAQAPQLAQAAENLTGPERVLAQDTALQAAGQNPALTAPSQSPDVQSFQQANQDYQQALAANAAASQNLQTAQTHLDSDKAAIDVARAQLNSITPSVQQQESFNKMLTAAQSDEELKTAADKAWDSTQVNLTTAREHAATALAALTPAPTNVASKVAASDSSVVDLSHSTHTQPNLLRSPSTTPLVPAVRIPPATVSAAPKAPALVVASDPLHACLAIAAHKAVGATPAPTPEQLHAQLEQSQEALRRLIENHEKEDALREQWEEETKEAVHDARKQAFDLTVDYVFHKAQAVTRAKIWRADAQAGELQKLLAAGGDPAKIDSLRTQLEQASTHRQDLQKVLDGLKEVKTRVEEQQRLRDLREFGSQDPKDLEQASHYLEGAKQLVQAALSENAVKNALAFTPYANDAIKWGSSLIDTGYDITAELLSLRQLNQLNRNSDQYLQAVKALDRRIHTTVDQLDCYKAEGAVKVASRVEQKCSVVDRKHFPRREKLIKASRQRRESCSGLRESRSGRLKLHTDLICFFGCGGLRNPTAFFLRKCRFRCLSSDVECGGYRWNTCC